MPELGRLEDAYAKVVNSLEEVAKGRLQVQAALREVFGLNQEIGRMARESPELAPPLRDMQLEVNAFTVQIKRNELGEAREALMRVGSALARVVEALAEGSSD